MGRKLAHQSGPRHNERCTKCKETIRVLLKKIYGNVEVSYKFDVGVLPEHFIHTPHYQTLKEIFNTLQNYRGHKEFVRSKTLRKCDFFIPKHRFILEFDESQHFTIPRKIALEHYPEGFKLGFDRERWIELCKEVNRKDNDPPYRDEQRAWYDALRDFLPEVEGLRPTIRIFSKDFQWCSLDPDNPVDIEEFKSILERG